MQVVLRADRFADSCSQRHGMKPALRRLFENLRKAFRLETNYAIFTIFQKSVKPIGFHSKPETVLRTPNSAAGWYKTI
jgi:hypothetical protein